MNGGLQKWRRTALALAVAAALASMVWVIVVALPRGAGGPATPRLARSTIVPPDRPELAIGRTTEYDYDPPDPGGYQLPAIRAATDGEVLGAGGEPRRLREVMSGRITLLSFIYTRCADPQACPYATGVLYKIHQMSKQDPVLADNLHLVTFSFDPEHDTPRRMADYGRGLRSRGDGAEWTFLTTASSKELTPILEGFGQRIDRKADPNDPLGPFYHLLRVYLIDREGMIRNTYSFGLLDPRLVLTDVRTLLLEEVARAGS